MCTPTSVRAQMRPQYLDQRSANAYQTDPARENHHLTRPASSPRRRGPLSHSRPWSAPALQTSRAACSLSSAGNAWKETHCHRSRFAATLGEKFRRNSTWNECWGSKNDKLACRAGRKSHGQLPSLTFLGPEPAQGARPGAHS